MAAVWAGGGDLDQLVDEASRLHPWMWVRGWGGGLLSGTRLGRAHRRAPARDDLRGAAGAALGAWPPTSTRVSASSFARGACATRCGLVQLPRGSSRLTPGTGDGWWTAGSSEVVPVRVARDMAGERSLVVAVDCNAGGRWPAADSFVAIALRAGLTMLRGRTRSELAGADSSCAPPIGESGWMQPRKIPSFYEAGREAAREALPTLRALLEG